jgi:hypothetical protein
VYWKFFENGKGIEKKDAATLPIRFFDTYRYIK